MKGGAGHAVRQMSMSTQTAAIRSHETPAQSRGSFFDEWTQAYEENVEQAFRHPEEQFYSREDNRSAERAEDAVALPGPQHIVCSETFTVTVPEGLHLRPAAMIVETASLFQCEIVIEYNGFSADAKSILGLMALGADCGSEVVVCTEGFDAGLALGAIGFLFLGGFSRICSL